MKKDISLTFLLEFPRLSFSPLASCPVEYCPPTSCHTGYPHPPGYQLECSSSICPSLVFPRLLVMHTLSAQGCHTLTTVWSTSWSLLNKHRLPRGQPGWSKHTCPKTQCACRHRDPHVHGNLLTWFRRTVISLGLKFGQCRNLQPGVTQLPIR